MENEFTIEIEKLIFGGDGLAHLPDGRSVFVPFVIPGETVKVQLMEEKARFARAVPIELVKPSPHRIQPKCRHFGICGGCHFQHISYLEQLQYKQAILIDQLKRIGKFNDPPVKEIIPSMEEWNYRNNIQFQPDEAGHFCYTDAQNANLMVVEECHLPQMEIIEVWPNLLLESDSGIKRVSIRKDSRDEVMVLFEGEDEIPPSIELDMSISSAYLNPQGRSVNLSGEDALLFEINGIDLRISPESFFQVNTRQAEKMVETVLQLLPQDTKNLNILELYAGAGLFSVFLAQYASQLTAIEVSPSACFDFAINLDSYDNVALYEGPVDEILPNLELSPDWVVMDPPRAGLDKYTRLALVKLNAPNIIYISCDPATLARDLKYLCESGYQLESVQPLDMFPQTYHVETMTVLRRTQRVTS